VDVRLRRDERRTGCAILALTVIGALGLVYGLVGAAIVGFGDREWEPLALLLLALLVLTGISTVITLVRGQGEIKAQGIRRIARGTLTIAGLLIVVGGLLGLAAFAFAFAVCVVGGKF
jgi:O-antigen/teichoic acid export membrane protein